MLDLKKAKYTVIRVGEIRRFVKQPRKFISQRFIAELAGSIGEAGQPAVPAIVKKLDPPIDGICYELVDGEQRWMACQKIGVTEIPVLVFDTMTEKEQYLLSLTTNVQRSTLTPRELALSIRELKSMDMSQREIAKQFGKSQSWVHMRYALLKLAPDVLALAGPEVPEEKRLSHMQAYLLVDLPQSAQLEVAQKVVDKQLSITEERKLIKETIHASKIKIPHKNTSRLRMIEDITVIGNFFTRTSNYLAGLLAKKEDELRAMFEDEHFDEVAKLKSAAEKNSQKFKEAGEAFGAVLDSMLSNEKGLCVIGSKGSDDTVRGETCPNDGQVDSLQTMRMLKILGIPKKMLYKRVRSRGRQHTYASFWHRPIDHLAILELARKTYRERASLIHPDKVQQGKSPPNDDDDNDIDISTLNRIWESLEERFKRHGFTIGK